MCLSAVYDISDNQKTLLCDKVALMTEKDGSLYFEDLFGNEYSYNASIKKVDLVENEILLIQNR